MLKRLTPQRRRRILADRAQVEQFERVPLVPNYAPQVGIFDSVLPLELLIDLARFDQLPKALRRALHETIVVWRAQPFAEVFEKKSIKGDDRRRMIRASLRVLMLEELREQYEYGVAYLKRWGEPLPHLAAKATIQRYGAR